MTSLYNRGLFHAAVSSPDYTVSNTLSYCQATCNATNWSAFWRSSFDILSGKTRVSELFSFLARHLNPTGTLIKKQKVPLVPVLTRQLSEKLSNVKTHKKESVVVEDRLSFFSEHKIKTYKTIESFRKDRLF
jgi:hypothetical protein